MMTRRTAVGAGIAFTLLTGAANATTFETPGQRRLEVPPVDALLVDETIELPWQAPAFVEIHGRTVPVVGIQLDAAAHAGLRQVFNNSHIIAGISSGATLFCLERIAWDHGFRLTGRAQHCAGSLDNDKGPQALAAFIDGRYSFPARHPGLDRTYRPSRADGLLHTWIMHKSPSRQSLQASKAVVL